jgi:hypothetical protein
VSEWWWPFSAEYDSVLGMSKTFRPWKIGRTQLLPPAGSASQRSPHFSDDRESIGKRAIFA